MSDFDRLPTCCRDSGAASVEVLPTPERVVVTIRCVLDGLLLHAEMCRTKPVLIAWDGDEPFAVEAVEAQFYELVSATPDEVLRLERAHYRLLRRASDFAIDSEAA